MKKTNLITLIVSGIAAIGAAGVAVGATYALFSDSETITHHLESGGLNITLLRTAYTKTSLNDEGYLESTSDNEEVDFSKETNENIFGLEEDEYLVPQSSYEASLRLMNGKKVNDVYEVSSTAFAYNVKLIVDEDSDAELLSQLRVTVSYGDNGKIEKKMSEFGNSPIFSGVMEKRDFRTDFTIKVSFDDSEDNNEAQEKKASFDLKVEAIQLTEKD